MNYKDILKKSTLEVKKMKGCNVDILDIKKPHSVEYAKHLTKIVSKISPLLGNMIEFSVVERLNKTKWGEPGKWIRQDPGFPDALFLGLVEPAPGIEIKTWFPLATEITARFKDSILHFENDQTNVVLMVWLPEFLIYGTPKIIDVWVGSAKSLALSRDKHYHKPPSYLVLEPEDTSGRTANLQQTNTNGYKFQGTLAQLKKAEIEIKRWGKNGAEFQPTVAYQRKVKNLLGRYPYRLDTNFAKIDRIQHNDLERFKKCVLHTKVNGKTVGEWARVMASEDSVIEQMITEII